MSSRSYDDFSREFERENDSAGVTDNTEPPAKTRRTVKACIQCRLRKQKCDGQSKDDPRRPCPRCIHLGAECSFLTTQIEDEASTSKVEKTAHRVERLQQEVADHEKRLRHLETLLDDFRKNVPSPDSPVRKRQALPRASSTSPRLQPRAGHGQTQSSLSPRSSRRQAADGPTASPGSNSAADRAGAGPLEAVDLGAPMTTLRLLRQFAGEWNYGTSAPDPVGCGLISIEEAQEAFDVFFANCHRWAPVLCPRSQRTAQAVRSACPTLFISVCAVGFRFMNGIPHHAYRNIVTLWDAALSRLLLRPTPADVHLDHIRALLLYIQWMPLDNEGNNVSVPRYNDVSSWSMLGLAIRYALLLGLHQDAVAPFANDCYQVVTVEDISRLRVWINLLTCDANLMLSSGLPASLNPEPVAAIAQSFASHRSASQPDDTRAAALCELVAILKRAAKSSGSPNVRALDSVSLRQANAELDTWEQSWVRTLGEDIQHSQMPFTTLRAYRLAINSACLSSLLSASNQPAQASLHELHALEVSLEAASQTIFALSAQAKWHTWQAQVALGTSFPPGPLVPDETAIERISYSVDSS